MGICYECCNGNNNDYDLINIKVDKDRKGIKNSSIGSQNQTGYNNVGFNDFRQSNSNQNASQKIYYSKKKLQLIIKQSKCLQEGKEYIINSLGLIDPKNNFKDGLVIFGDVNVSLIINIFKYSQIQGQILCFLQRRAILLKTMQKFIMIKL
jgi:hypothetical protein